MINHISNFDYNVLSHVFKELPLTEIERNKTVCVHFYQATINLFKNIVHKEKVAIFTKTMGYAKKYTFIQSALDGIKPLMIGSILIDQKALRFFMKKLNQEIAKEITKFPEPEKKHCELMQYLLREGKIFTYCKTTLAPFFTNEEVFTFFEKYGLSKSIARLGILKTSIPSDEFDEFKSFIICVLDQKFHSGAYKIIFEVWHKSVIQNEAISTVEEILENPEEEAMFIKEESLSFAKIYDIMVPLITFSDTYHYLFPEAAPIGLAGDEIKKDLNDKIDEILSMTV